MTPLPNSGFGRSCNRSSSVIEWPEVAGRPDGPSVAS
jgi:hypothetical protein